MKKICKIVMFALSVLTLCGGCRSWEIPEGNVPDSLVGPSETEDTALMELKDAEAAMCGAIVRTMIRNGHVSERVPIAFTLMSTEPQESFVSLLTGTDLIWICGEDSAKYLIDSKTEKNVWHLRLKKKDGTVLMEKTLKHR